ncbi:uncharacterized protein LOC100375826 [Saccoglossus kowalevskii]|uniref:Uncharacterized protein LOC100375826 n=1 Tax=Saccoglossus kowalevskii TaxID=10224 RepID=A0ABM0GSZ2_SACKO|nr:PREDICTED: uncharacterized protein LOC100375826 [Saccoglossus kowalevskii]
MGRLTAVTTLFLVVAMGTVTLAAVELTANTMVPMAVKPTFVPGTEATVSFMAAITVYDGIEIMEIEVFFSQSDTDMTQAVSDAVAISSSDPTIPLGSGQAVLDIECMATVIMDQGNCELYEYLCYNVTTSPEDFEGDHIACAKLDADQAGDKDCGDAISTTPEQMSANRNGAKSLTVGFFGHLVSLLAAPLLSYKLA